MDDLKTHLEFERIFNSGKQTDYDKGAIYFDFEEVPPVFVGFSGVDSDGNFSAIRDLCRKFFVLGVKLGKTETV